MRVLIDADMPAHEVGHIKVDSGETDSDGNAIMKCLSRKEIEPLAKGQFMSIVINSECGGFSSYLTKGKTFRDKVATILGYKANRQGASRDNVDVIKGYYHKTFNSEWCDGYEADDAMAMEQWSDLMATGGELQPEEWDESAIMGGAATCIASRDKDLDTVPGWHYKWFVKRSRKQDGTKPGEEERKAEKGEVYWVTFIQAIRNFYRQLLVGDTADNIHGLHGIGPKSAWVKQLEDMDNEEDMYEHVEEKYVKYYRNYGLKFLRENATLLHMWRRKDDEWLPPHERDEDYWICD